MTLTLENALRAYARMMNTGDTSDLEPLLADDFHYASQNVIAGIESKAGFLEYISGKLRRIKQSSASVYAELGDWDAYGGGPCVVLAQGDKDNLMSVVTGKVEGDKLVRLDMCVVPPPKTARRSSEYPV